MKPIVLVPPAAALVVAAIWLGSQRRAMSVLEDESVILRQQIEAARHADPSGDDGYASIRKTGTAKTGGKKLDWKEIAKKQQGAQRGDNIQEMRTMVEMQKVLLAMSSEELSAQMDEIAALDITDELKQQLQGMLVGVLAAKDPQLVLDRFADQLGSERGGMTWQLSNAFRQWATKDTAAAAAWMDRQIAAGKFESKSLDGKSQSRMQFEGALVLHLLADNPQAAAARIAALPVDQRREALGNGIFFNLKPGTEKAAADLIRTQIPEGERVSTLASSAGNLIHQGGFERVGKFISAIDADPKEREAIVAQAFQIKMGNSRDSAKAPAAIEEGRAWTAEQAPEAVDRITGQALGSMNNFQQASDLALKYHEESGNDEVLVAFLNGGAVYRNAPAALLLVDKIADEQKREEIRKKLQSHEGGMLAPTPAPGN